MMRFTTRTKHILGKLTALLFWVAIWQVCYLLVHQELLVAAPLHVAQRLVQLGQTAAFWQSAGASLVRILAGFLIAIAVGSILAVLTHFISPLRVLFSPFVSIVRATPVASFILLALVWMRTGIMPAFISFLMVLPIVFSNISQGLQVKNVQLLEMASIYKLNRKKRMQAIYLPTLAPYFKAAWTGGLGLAWKAGVSAEVIGTPALSIGKELHTAKITLETVDLFAWTLTVILLSVVLEKLLTTIIQRILGRYGKGVASDD